MIQRRPRSASERPPSEPLRASVPSGNWTVEPGVWLVDVSEFQRDLLDILYGPARPRTGEGWVEMDGSRGRYRIWRNFQTGQAKIIGRCIPDPGLIPPGEFLLGHDRDTEEGRLDLRSDQSLEHVKTNASLLQSRAEQMMRHAGRFTPVAIPIAPTQPVDTSESNAALLKLEQAIRRFHDLEAERLERQSEWEQTIGECSRRLASPNELAQSNAHIHHLEMLLEEWSKLCQLSAPKPLRSAELMPWLLSLGLAGLGLIAAGRFLSEGSLTVVGFGLVLGTLLPYPILALRRQKEIKAHQQKKTKLQAQLKQALLKVKVLPPSGDIDVTQIREAITKARVRDGLSEVKETLDQAIAPTKVREVRTQLVDILRKGVDPELSERAATRWKEDPLLALPSLIESLGGALDQERELQARPPAMVEVQQDASVALRQEASQLFRRAAALKRMIRANDLIESLQSSSGGSRHSLHARIESHRSRGGTWPLFLASSWLPQNLGAWKSLVERLATDPPGEVILIAPPDGLSPLEALEELPQSLRSQIGVLMPQRLLSRAPSRRPREEVPPLEATTSASSAN